MRLRMRKLYRSTMSCTDAGWVQLHLRNRMSGDQAASRGADSGACETSAQRTPQPRLARRTSPCGPIWMTGATMGSRSRRAHTGGSLHSTAGLGHQEGCDGATTQQR